MADTGRTLYVISDLHLGGKSANDGTRGFRLCTNEERLADFVSALADRTAETIELVLNGDTVDFLAEEAGDSTWRPFHFPEDEAITRLNTIAERDGPKQFFGALVRFLECPRHRLVVLPGNHDIELNLPAVKKRFRRLAGPSRPVDYEFAGGGEAYRAGDVLIEHGDRADDWNRVDYESLQSLCKLLSRGLRVSPGEEFVPPPGSRLVAEMINPIKNRYSFIDLLKPETGAAFPILLALEPELRSELGALARLWAEKTARKLLPRVGGTGGERLISTHDESTGEKPRGLTNEDALADVLRHAGAPPDFMTSSGGRQERLISTTSTLRGWWHVLKGGDRTRRERIPDLVIALRCLRPPDAFDISTETHAPSWNEAIRLTERSREIRHVVFGPVLSRIAEGLRGGVVNAGIRPAEMGGSI